MDSRKLFPLCLIFLLFFLFLASFIVVFGAKLASADSGLVVPAGTYTLYLKLGHFQGGTTFVEDRQLTASEKSQFKVEIWTQPTSTYGSGRKVAEGQIGSPISLQPGNYQAFLKGSLPSPYNTTKQVPSGCLSFSISSSQPATCTLEAYNKDDSSNYNLPSQERPSGAPPMIEVDSSLGSYQFVKNVVDMTGSSTKIHSMAFANLYGKKVMLVSSLSFKKGAILPSSVNLFIYDIDNPFNPQLLKVNAFTDELQKMRSLLMKSGYYSKILILDSHPFIYGRDPYINDPSSPSLFAKINPDWSLSKIEELKIKEKNGNTNHIFYLQSLFRGTDGKPYGLGTVYEGEKSIYRERGVIVDLSEFPAPVVGEIIDDPSLGTSCYEMPRQDYCGTGIVIYWDRARPVRVANKLYLVLPIADTIGRLHLIERSWVSVFDITDPSQPRRIGSWKASGLSGQLHFPDASGAEKAKIYADAGLIEIDSATGYVYDIFPHMYDFQNSAYPLTEESSEAFNKIPGPWRYRNGVIIRKLNESGNFDFVSRFTLCEVEGIFFSYCINPEKNFSSLPNDATGGTHAYNGLILMRDYNKSSIEKNLGINVRGSPVVISIMVGNELKIIPDTSDEFLKFKDSLSKTYFQSAILRDEILELRDAHLQQVNDRTFAIFQIHPASIDVVKLTLTQSRPIPQREIGYPTSPISTTTPATTSFATSSIMLWWQYLQKFNEYMKYTTKFWQRFLHGY